MARALMFSCLSLMILGLTSPVVAQNVIPRSSSVSTTNASTTAACHAIDTLLPGVVAFPVRDLVRFEAELNNYWSTADTDLVPTCIAFPIDANETSTIVKVLNNYTDVTFAVKSGGHSPNVGWSSVQGGVLIAMSSNAATTVSTDGATATVGPGARWSAVMDTLQPYGKAVPGGRIGDVGVGGYVLGGGLSYLSAQTGFACDSVVQYEVVLANGDIVSVTNTTHPDLFFALKGGGNQFGIITKYTFHTYDIGLIWGGVRTYIGSDSVNSALINATYDFITNNNDSKAAVIVTSERSATIDLWILFFFYDGPVPPPGVFDKYNAVVAESDLVTTQTYASMLDALDSESVKARYLLREITLPNLPQPHGLDLYNWMYDTWASYAVAQSTIYTDFTLTLAFQPMPVGIPRASQNSVAGPNALGLDPKNGDHVWMEFTVIWDESSQDDAAHSTARNISEEIANYARTKYRGVTPTHYGGPSADDVDELGDSGLTYQEYDPIFMNDAMYDQQPLQSYPLENYVRLVAAKEKYDPTGFFTKRTGGFKL